MIRLTFFAGPKVIEGLGTYGRVAGGYIELSSKNDFAGVYKDLQIGSANIPNELSTAYQNFSEITSTLKILDERYNSWIIDNSELFAEIKRKALK